MKKILIMTVILLTAVLCLHGIPGLAEGADFSGIAGIWYTEEYMMRVSEDGRFVMELNDEDWAGSLKADRRMNEEEEDYVAYLMILDEPDLSLWEEIEFVPDIHHPGKAVFFGDGNPIDDFYDVPVCIRDVTDEEPEYYEPYALIHDADEDDEWAVTVMFTLLRPATDVAVLRMYDQEIDDEGNLGFSGEALEWWAELDSQERIMVTHVFDGDLPDLAIHFVAEDGTPHDLAVQISGADGELDLLPLPAAEG